MMFLGHLLMYALKYVFIIAVSCVGGIFVGKKLRERKDAQKKGEVRNIK